MLHSIFVAPAYTLYHRWLLYSNQYSRLSRPPDAGHGLERPHGWGYRSSRPPYRPWIQSAQRGPAGPLSSGFGSRGTGAPGSPGFADTSHAVPAIFPRPAYQTPVRRLPRNSGHPAPVRNQMFLYPLPEGFFLPSRQMAVTSKTASLCAFVHRNPPWLPFVLHNCNI